MRILRLCLDDALTNKEIAQRLQRDPASVLHHVRTLVDTGFLEALPARRGRAGLGKCRTGRPEVVADQRRRCSSVMLQAFLDELAAAEARRELIATRLTVNADHWDEFLSRIQAVLDDFAGRASDVDGERWSIFFATHATTAAPAEIVPGVPCRRDPHFTPMWHWSD